MQLLLHMCPSLFLTEVLHPSHDSLCRPSMHEGQASKPTGIATKETRSAGWRRTIAVVSWIRWIRSPESRKKALRHRSQRPKSPRGQKNAAKSEAEKGETTKLLRTKGIRVGHRHNPAYPSPIIFPLIRLKQKASILFQHVLPSKVPKL